MPQDEAPGVLFNLHLLRALAALGVVYFHTTSEAGLSLPVNIGAHGVDVFFVISGFIIAYVGMRSPDRFFTRRLIRVVPFYWTATLVVFVAACLFPHIFRSTRQDYVQLICSLLFLPRETAYAGMFPTLLLGWSLNYEMYFYVMFAAALAISRRYALLLCSAGIALVTGAIDLSGVLDSSIRFYARPLVFEFVFGIFACYLFNSARNHTEWFASRSHLRWILVILATLAACAIGIEEYHQSFGIPRFISAGVPAFVLVLSVLLLEGQYGLAARSRLIFLVGESSYILYLIHPYVIYGVLRTAFAHHHGGMTTLQTVMLVTALMSISTVVAVLIHLWFEKPLLSRLKNLSRPRRAALNYAG